MNVSYSESKTDLKLRCDCCIKFQLFEGDQDVFSKFTAVGCMLLPHNPYRLPQHYKRHVCGPSCSCKHRYLWVSPIFKRYFCLNYVDTVRHWQPLWSTTRVHFKGQCWYFNPQWTSEQAIIKARSVRTLTVSWKERAVTKCLHIYLCLWMGLGGGGGTFWLLNESLTLRGPAA